jgi:zinc protease
MLMQMKKLTLSLCLIGFSAGAFAQTVLLKSEHNIEEDKLHQAFRA